MRVGFAVLGVLALAAPAGAQVLGSCAPVSASAGIYASADRGDVHPDWADGSEVGLSWTFEMRGDETGADGATYLYGDLLDPRGNVVDEGVYVSDLEWECDAPQ